MKDRRYSDGFTIIEVMLFLAISGLMLAGLMVGIGGSVNRERYNDAVTSFHDYMQGQYNLVDNVSTNRPADYTCDSSGITLTPSVGEDRGRSECSIIGRLINSQNGSQLTSQPIYATIDVTSIETDNMTEQELIEALQLRLAPEVLSEDVQKYSLAWGTSIRTDNSENGAFSLALIRLPTNSLIRSFTVPSYQSTIQAVVASSSDQPVVLCVAPDGLVSSPPMGVKLSSIATNANSVQRISGSDGSCT